MKIGLYLPIKCGTCPPADLMGSPKRMNGNGRQNDVK